MSFYPKIEKFVSALPEIEKFDCAVAGESPVASSQCPEYVATMPPSQSVIVNQANQSIKAILTSRAYHLTHKNVFFVCRDDKLAEEMAEDFVVLNDEGSVYFIPDYETLPGEQRSPHYMIRAGRMRAICRLLSVDSGQCKSPIVNGQSSTAIYCLSYRNLLRHIIPPEFIAEQILNLKISEEYDPSDLISYLVNTGYEHTTQIEKVGQFSKRGGIIDVFSPNYTEPIRIEFFGDEIVSQRHFSVATQRSSLKDIDTITLIPCREVIINEAIKKSPLYEKVATQGFYEGIEGDIPQLYEGVHTLFDYASPENSLFFFDNGQEQIDNGQFAIGAKHQIHFLNTGTMHQPPNYQLSAINYQLHSEPSPFFNSDLQILEQHIKTLTEQGYKIFIQNENTAQRHRMSQLLGIAVDNGQLTIDTDLTGIGYSAKKPDYSKISNISDTPALTNYQLSAINCQLSIGVLHKGFIWHDIKLAVFTDHEIFKRVKHKKLDVAFSKGEAIVDYDSLKPGDYIVHIEHGIGIYEGIKTLELGGKKIECLTIQYADTDRVYVPTWQLKLVAKYVSEEGNVPTIHKLGTKQWEATKQKARRQIELVVDDIVRLYAERKLRKGVAFQSDTDWQMEMEQAFIYDDTPDQATATREIKADMEQEAPMERLLCGDVGFGKTEVAIRAAFKAVMSDFQVAVLVPTTLLAEQHYNVFRERLAQFPIRIAMLSRFRTTADLNKDLARIRAGEIDIAIGTHRLLSRDVVFKKIGLLIIDEEHRFGVKHKEKIRQLKANIDTLYMSATPIPRTMNMVLSKLKAMSLIQTSPLARLPIRTVIVPYDTEIIKDAIQREIDRGGQVFFVHNRVETIESIYLELRKILPDIRIAIGHGQLPEKRLEQVMIDFADHKYDVLLATTIIESGIDIPNANTILINRADMFGLAQLYQIRGRVGRSNRRAYAYLMIPRHLTDIARKRLETLTEYESLGAGYQIAMRDLEIRGAGTLLGTKQSGIITSVGFNFYNKLLDQAVKNILEKNPKGLWDEEEDAEAVRQIELGTDFYFPANYIPDEKQKLQIYKRMVDFETAEQFDEIAVELKDRFGDLPDMAQNVVDYFKLRTITRNMGIKSFIILTDKMVLEFGNVAAMSSSPQSTPLIRKGEKSDTRKLLSKLMTISEIPVRFDTTGGLKVIFEFPEYMQKDKRLRIEFAMRIVQGIINYE